MSRTRKDTREFRLPQPADDEVTAQHEYLDDLDRTSNIPTELLVLLLEESAQ